MARFVCTIILHLSMQDEVKRGLDLMKFALNHPVKFQMPYQAAFIGMLQAVTTLGVESISILVIVAADTT